MPRAASFLQGQSSGRSKGQAEVLVAGSSALCLVTLGMGHTQ